MHTRTHTLYLKIGPAITHYINLLKQYSTAGIFINQWMGVPGQSTAARLYGGISDEL